MEPRSSVNLLNKHVTKTKSPLNIAALVPKGMKFARVILLKLLLRSLKFSLPKLL
jgi:hypothetical protein